MAWWSTDQTVVIKLNNIDITDVVRAQSLYVRQNIGNTADVASFRIRDESGMIVANAWDQVTIDVDGVRLFGGYVVQVETVVEEPIQGTSTYDVECKDWSIVLDTIQIEERYGNFEDAGSWQAWLDTEIIKDIFNTYLSSEGFDFTTHVTSQGGARIAFDNVTVRDALNGLAKQVQADWYISPNKYLYWFNPTNPGNAVFSIKTNNPDYSTSYPPLRASLRSVSDAIGIINEVVVLGGYNEYRVNETITYVSGTSRYTVQHPHIKSVVQVKANTTGAGPIPAVNASNRLGYSPEDSLVDDGGEAYYLVDLKTGTIDIDSTVTGYMSAGDTIEIDYVYLEQVTTTRTDATSIATYGRTFKKTFYDETLSNIEAAQKRADQILAEYANPRVTVVFDVAEHGLLPGRLLTIDAPEIGIGSENVLVQENLLLLLLENGDYLLLEEAGTTQKLLIQQIQIRAVPVQQDQFLVVANVQAGVYQNTLVEALTRLGASGGFSSGSGTVQAERYPGALSNIASDMGEIVAGRATLTDGGTAPFVWTDYAGHTGVVLGLNDSGTAVHGEFLLVEKGTAKAKIGLLDGMTGWGTVTPSGWGIWTTNGYFSGVVAASLLSGGTVTGSLILGGTVTGALVSGGTVQGNVITGGTVTGAYISGGTIDSGYLTGVNGDFSGTITATEGRIGDWIIKPSYLYSDGGTIQTGSVVNSSNPGVRMDSSGLFGYGTVGLTFALYSDPAKKPWFSSGTINNVVYEVYEAAVLRTGPDPFTDGGIQLDNSGLFGIDPNGTGFLLLENGDDVLLLEDAKRLELEEGGLTFWLDTATGGFAARNAWISGTVYADAGVFNGTVYADAGVFNGTVYADAGSFSGTVFADAGTFAGTVSGSHISGGTVTGALVSGGTITGAYISGAIVEGGEIRTTSDHITWTDANGIQLYNPWVTSGSAYPEDIKFVDGSGNVQSYIQCFAFDATLRVHSQADIHLYPNSNLRVFGDLELNGYMRTNLTPKAGLTMALGQSTQRWEVLYSERVNTYTVYSNGLNIESGTVTFNGVVNSNIVPHVDNGVSVGDSSKGFASIYLSDGTGPWRVYVDSSGNLQTAKAY